MYMYVYRLVQREFPSFRKCIHVYSTYMYMYMYVRMYVYTYVHTCICIYVSMYVRMYSVCMKYMYDGHVIQVCSKGWSAVVGTPAGSHG